MVNNAYDQSFNQAARIGMEQAKEKYPEQFDYEIIEYGFEPVEETILLDVLDSGNFTHVVTPNQFTSHVVEYAPDYQDTKFWVYGDRVDFEENDLPNVASFSYLSNEASLLAGYLAGSLTETDVVSVISGQSGLVTQDFMVAYAQGAKLANEDTRVLSAYADSWTDIAKVKELAASQGNEGSDVMFQVAGLAGAGVFEYAAESSEDIHTIGVDMDQRAVYTEEGRDDYAESIVTSVLSNIDTVILGAVEQELGEGVAYGQQTELGLETDAVGIVRDEAYTEIVPEETQVAIDELEQQIINDEIEVNSSYDMTTDEINQYLDDVAK